jgi:hypothetical protein
MSSIPESGWTKGSLLTPVVPISQLKSLTGSAGGNPIWKSNNPEPIDGNGWLMQNERTDSIRGGSAFPLSGLFNIYLFHINRTSSVRVLHVLVKNPNSTSITVTGKGSMLTNSTYPLGGKGTGQSFHVSQNWLLDTNLTPFSKAIAPGETVEIDRAILNPKNMVDGRFEVNATDGVFVCTVITSDGSKNSAISVSQGSPAPGDIRSPGSDRLGREAGICNSSIWKGTTDIDLPPAPAYVGLCLNTISPQNQTVAHVMHLSDCSAKTSGNYGHKYDVTLRLNNQSSTVRRVRLSFGSSANNPNLSRTYSGPVLVNGTQINIFTTPTDPKNELKIVTINPNCSVDIQLVFFVPGLITIPQQLILETV